MKHSFTRILSVILALVMLAACMTITASASTDVKAYGKGTGARSLLVDASALFVAQTSRLRNGGKGCFDKHGKRSEKNYCGDQGCVHGIDFSEASKPNGKNHISLTQMSFGYAGHEFGPDAAYHKLRALELGFSLALRGDQFATEVDFP